MVKACSSSLDKISLVDKQITRVGLNMNYHQRFSKVIDYIGQHLDETLSLDSLSDQFYISRFHFHRLFTAYTGLSLQQYIRWLRLKRAAFQLVVDKDQSIITIAMNAGFESHEAFSRTFKKACGLSPSEYRQQSGSTYWNESPYSLPKQEKTKMNIEIRKVNKTRLAMIEHRGDPKNMADSLHKLLAWIGAQPIDLTLKPGNAFAFAYDDPQKTEPAHFRFDIGVKIPENFIPDKNMVVEKSIPAGRYAVAMHKGSRSNIGDTIYFMYRNWLPESGEQLGDLPCVFCYYNFDHEVAETEALTECWLLLK